MWSKFNQRSNAHEYILPDLWNNISVRSHFNAEAVEGNDKCFQIGSAYYFTQSDSEKQIGHSRGFYLQHLSLFVFGDSLQPFRGRNSPHYTPSSISLTRMINIFFQYSQPQQLLILFCQSTTKIILLWSVLHTFLCSVCLA